ncbi:MAG: hypothetical protein ACYDGS_01095 [Thermoleophilia bacterium]
MTSWVVEVFVEGAVGCDASVAVAGSPAVVVTGSVPPQETVEINNRIPMANPAPLRPEFRLRQLHRFPVI